jgi:hypothetical protein
MKKLPREMIHLVIEEKRLVDEMQAMIDKVAPENYKLGREKYRDDPEKLAEWEAEWADILRPDPPRPKAKRAVLPKKEEGETRGED